MRTLPVCSLLLALRAADRRGDTLVEDPAGLLDAPARERLAGYHAVLLRDLDIHFKAVFLAGRSGDIDRIAVELFDRYRLGARTRPPACCWSSTSAGQQVRLEIGYDLEGVFPDGFVGRVEEEQMVPFFAAAGRIGAGVAATVELLVARPGGQPRTRPGLGL